MAMLRLTNWLSAPAAIWCDGLNRFDTVYPFARIALHNN